MNQPHHKNSHSPPRKNRRLPPALQTASDYLVYLAVRTLICLLQILSPAQCQRLSEWAAPLFSKRLKIRWPVVDENLSHAFPAQSPEWRQQTYEQMWEHLLLMIGEIALARRKIHLENWRHHVNLVNGRPLVQGMLAPRPFIVVTGHYGNFEMSGFLAGLFGFPTFTLARDLDNPFLHRFLRDFRESTGQFILSAKGTADDAQAVLDSAETLALLGDHFGGRKGCWVDFFNRPASCHKALALFSLSNKAPMSVLFARRHQLETESANHPDQPPSSDGLERTSWLRPFRMMYFDLETVDTADPLEAAETGLSTVPDVTKWYNQRTEAMIRTAPEQYWWLHRRWKDPRKKKRAATAA